MSTTSRRGTGTGTSSDADNRAQGLAIGWTVFSYLISGMIAYGAIGWLIGRAVHTELLFPIGMIVGLAISVGYVIYRYGRQTSTDVAPSSASRGERPPDPLERSAGDR
jgi:ATP synthase protein I